MALFLISAQVGFAQIPKEKIISLDTVFVLAERNSTHLKISKSISETANMAIDVAENLRLPSVDVGISAMYLGDATIFDRNFSNAQNAAMPHFGNNFSAEASYVVFAGDAVSNAIEKAELESQIATLSHDKNRMDIRLLVAGQYLDLYKLYNQKKVFNKNIEETNELIRHVKAKLTTGMALDNDLTRYELMLQNLKLALIEIENNISIVNIHLTIALGLPDETVIIPDSSVQNINELPLFAENLVDEANEKRPSVKIQSLQKEVAQKDIKLAKADLYPSVAIFGADYFEGPITMEVPPINKNLNYWYLGVGIKCNLASLYKSSNKISLAKSSLNTANYAYEAELENTRTAIYSAQTKYGEAYEKLYTYQKSFQLASENYAVINNRYQNDLALITEMLDASNMKLKAELQVINAKLDVVFNYYKLLREIGTL
ncbi:TolC family protein [Tangfeifania diversioriginum]|uniref:TolC family protein n=1 Tax=Tangfeifania diversioriginum TaxID=1168035 RepID=UPI001587CE1E|nr:TolC family protein [Tangfeifania diversioriginum]